MEFLSCLSQWFTIDSRTGNNSNSTCLLFGSKYFWVHAKLDKSGKPSKKIIKKGIISSDTPSIETLSKHLDIEYLNICIFSTHQPINVIWKFVMTTHVRYSSFWELMTKICLSWTCICIKESLILFWTTYIQWSRKCFTY